MSSAYMFIHMKILNWIKDTSTPWAQRTTEINRGRMMNIY